MKKTLAALLSIAVLMAPACGSEVPERELQASPATSPQTEEPTEQPGPRAQAEVEIYSAVIRRLVTEDHTFGSGESPFKQVFVVDGPIEDAGDPMNGSAAFGPSPHPFTPEVKEGIAEELNDLPPLEFVSNANEVRSGEDGMEGPKGNGVIVSLGPIEPHKNKTHVSNMLWCGGLCGQWLTYVLEESEGDWNITGTTGPSAIS